MRKLLLFLAASPTIVSFANNGLISSPKEKEKTPALFYVSAGGALSAVDFSRYSGGPRFWGYNFRAFGNITPSKRISLEYTKFSQHILPPFWNNVSTWNADANFHFVFDMKNSRSNFYALTGIDYNYWQGNYDGTLTPDKNYKQTGERNLYRTTRIGANFGTGFNLHMNEVGLFTELRFCLAPSPLNTKLRIMDVVYSAGISYGIPVPKKKHDDKNKRKSFGMPNGIYKWIKKKRD